MNKIVIKNCIGADAGARIAVLALDLKPWANTADLRPVTGSIQKFLVKYINNRRKGCINCRNLPQILALKKRCRLYSKTNVLRDHF